MLRTSLLILLFSSFFSLASSQQFLQVLIRDIDNPAGTLLNGNPCGNFGFLGFGCQNTWLRAQITAGDSFPSSPSALQISSHGENKISNINILIEDQGASGYTEFTGFNVSIQLGADQAFENSVDLYSFRVDSTESQGIFAYTSSRPGTLPTTLNIAWSTNIAPPATTTAGTTTGVFTGSTETPTSTLPPTTTPKLPADCDELEDKASGVKTIYPDGVTPVQVYCQQNSYGAYTTIQSRVSTSSVNFNVTLSDYFGSFGTPGIATSFWLGLNNMNLMTSAKTYSLQIDLCCGGSLISKQIYHNFKIGDNSTGFVLNANADVPGIGLDYASTVKDIGSKFATYDTYVLPSKKAGCDEFEFEDDDGINAVPYGGWWYGSCGNNLNGAPVTGSDLDSTTCALKNFANNKKLGINLRKDKNPTTDGWDVDEISYDRVRMVIFTFDSLNVERNDDTFCKS